VRAVPHPSVPQHLVTGAMRRPSSPAVLREPLCLVRTLRPISAISFCSRELWRFHDSRQRNRSAKRESSALSRRRVLSARPHGNAPDNDARARSKQRPSTSGKLESFSSSARGHRQGKALTAQAYPMFAVLMGIRAVASCGRHERARGIGLESPRSVCARGYRRDLFAECGKERQDTGSSGMVSCRRGRWRDDAE